LSLLLLLIVIITFLINFPDQFSDECSICFASFVKKTTFEKTFGKFHVSKEIKEVDDIENIVALHPQRKNGQKMHLFHKGCIQNWVNTKMSRYEVPSCPVCNEGLIQNAGNRNRLEQQGLIFEIEQQPEQQQVPIVNHPLQAHNQALVDQVVYGPLGMIQAPPQALMDQVYAPMQIEIQQFGVNHHNHGQVPAVVNHVNPQEEDNQHGQAPDAANHVQPQEEESDEDVWG
jgi:hypothetical protein